MSDYIWRTSNTSAKYVDSDTGDDINGNGTKDNPYQTLGKAWRGASTKPSVIICRGRFSEDMADGNHAATIQADYKGGAIFDGADMYTLYGFTTTNLILLNCVPGGKDSPTVNTGSAYLAGVGRASGASGVGHTGASYLWGLAGSGGIVGQSGHYFGMVGGSGSRNCIFNPRCNDEYKLWFFAYNKPEQWCIHGVKNENRRASRNSTDAANGFKLSVFTDCAFWASDHLEFTDCAFGSDCTWWNTNGTIQIIPEGTTSEEKIASVAEQMATYTTNVCTFKNCIFLDKTADEIFNGPNVGDFSLKLDSGVPEGYGPVRYGINIPILDDSTGKPGTWDEKTAKGLIKIEDNQIKLNDVSSETSGEVLSKVITLDTSKCTLRGLVSLVASKFANKSVQFYDRSIFEEQTYGIGDTLPANKKFKVLSGSAMISDRVYYVDDIITTTSEELLNKSDEADSATVVALKSCNVANAIFVRSNATVYETLDTSVEQTLDPDTTYLNISENDITVTLEKGGTYSVKPHESVNGAISSEPAPNTMFGILFANKSIEESNWIPVQVMGESRVDKSGNKFERDENGDVMANGNPNYYKTTAKSPQYITNKYIQFKIEVHK